MDRAYMKRTRIIYRVIINDLFSRHTTMSRDQSSSQPSSQSSSFTCFAGNRRIASGSLQRIAAILKQFQSDATTTAVLVFDDATGRTVDLDPRGSDPNDAPPADEGRGRSRPRLGVVPREVTLLPRHWEWLATQPGGASVALRRLVEEARRTGSENDRIRQAHERTYHFMSAIAGNLPGFEEAIRALFAHDRDRFSNLLAAWPADIRDHAVLLGFGTAS
jgi:hypothetical protein